VHFTQQRRKAKPLGEAVAWSAYSWIRRPRLPSNTYTWYGENRQTQNSTQTDTQNANTRTKPSITDCTAKRIHLKIVCPSMFVQIHDVLERTSRNRRFL